MNSEKSERMRRQQNKTHLLCFKKRETTQLQNSDHYKSKQNKARESGRRRKHVSHKDLFVILNDEFYRDFKREIDIKKAKKPKKSPQKYL